MKLKEALKGVIPKSKMEYAPSSFDVVGDIAILEIPDEVKKYEKKIASILLGMHKHIKVVVRKHGIHKGKFRIQEYRILAGERRKKTLHKENGVRLMLHIEKTYYSTRSATERLRLAKLVKPGENILVMFGGVAPYALVLSKNSPAKHIMSVELNPYAHKYALENIALNKVHNAEAICGDVRNIVPRLVKEQGRFDRIMMPLPKNAEDFLDTALSAVKKRGTIHFYYFGSIEEQKAQKAKIKEICNKQGRKCEILDVVKCGQFSPNMHRICIDFRAL